ncbi:MAG: shikimate kinase [Bifidobacteriaceae bacterium]|jgi:shikimate kinase|nr:shikimate kinase [Bifidobacteriaceae bacterium]
MSALVLIGPPAAGKTTVGRELASLLNLRFLDTDQMVEQRSGQTVSQIFLNQGEAEFRVLERAAAAEALAASESEGLVIALGGGAPLDVTTAERLKNNHHNRVVFLDISDSLAARRVGLNASRPLLKESPRRVWRELMAQRRPTYEALAWITLKVDGLAPAQTAARIAQMVMAKES